MCERVCGFFFQAEDGIRDGHVTGVQTCALPILLAVAKRLRAAGKDVIELEIGDSPFPATAAAKKAGMAAIEADQSHYCPSAGMPELREAAAEYVNRCYGLRTTAANVVPAHGAKIF